MPPIHLINKRLHAPRRSAVHGRDLRSFIIANDIARLRRMLFLLTCVFIVCLPHPEVQLAQRSSRWRNKSEENAVVGFLQLYAIEENPDASAASRESAKFFTWLFSLGAEERLLRAFRLQARGRQASFSLCGAPSASLPFNRVARILRSELGRALFAMPHGEGRSKLY